MEGGFRIEENIVEPGLSSGISCRSQLVLALAQPELVFGESIPRKLCSIEAF